MTAGILEEEENHKNFEQEKRDRLIAFKNYWRVLQPDLSLGKMIYGDWQ